MLNITHSSCDKNDENKKTLILEIIIFFNKYCTENILKVYKSVCAVLNHIILPISNIKQNSIKIYNCFTKKTFIKCLKNIVLL